MNPIFYLHYALCVVGNNLSGGILPVSLIFFLSHSSKDPLQNSFMKYCLVLPSLNSLNMGHFFMYEQSLFSIWLISCCMVSNFNRSSWQIQNRLHSCRALRSSYYFIYLIMHHKISSAGKNWISKVKDEYCG